MFPKDSSSQLLRSAPERGRFSEDECPPSLDEPHHHTGVRHTSRRDMSASQGAVPHGHPHSLVEAVSLVLHPQP